MPHTKPIRGTLQVRNLRARKPVLLSFGFAALLLVLAASAFLVWRNATQAQARVSALHEAHMRSGAALSAIRSNAYMIGILTRDYLLDSDLGQSGRYVQQLNAIRQDTEEIFRELNAAAHDDPAQHAAIAKMQREFAAYWDPTEIALDWSPAEKRAQRARVLRERVRRRQEVFALTSQVEQLITANYLRERERITSSDQEFRLSLGYTAAFALLLGLAIAAVTLGRMLKLERQSVAAESELRRLSGQIRTAQEQERKYLSRELHDQVGQMLTGLRMELAGIARIYPQPESDFSSRIAHAKGTVEQTLRIVRNIAMLLRPSMLDDLGLTPALAWLIKEVSRSSGIEIQSNIDPSLDSLPDAHRTCLYRVVQEALTNATRHSGGSRIDVALWSGDGWVNGMISDDGRGFDRSSGKPEALGLLGMEERARELGGSIRIETAPGRGTRVEVRLPRPARPGEGHDQDLDSGRPRDHSDRVEASA
jgi:glucose-6-phosphate-specific signal transduction histidine kinase